MAATSNREYPMSHHTVKFTTDNGAIWRELPDTQNTHDYLVKLSHAHVTEVTFATGEWWAMECGEITASGY